MKAIFIDEQIWEVLWKGFFSEIEIDVLENGKLKTANNALQKRWVYYAQSLKQAIEKP